MAIHRVPCSVNDVVGKDHHELCLGGEAFDCNQQDTSCRMRRERVKVQPNKGIEMLIDRT